METHDTLNWNPLKYTLWRNVQEFLNDTSLKSESTLCHLAVESIILRQKSPVAVKYFIHKCSAPPCQNLCSCNMLSKMKCTGSSFVFCQRDILGPDKNAAEWLVHQEYQARTIERCLQGCREGTHLLRSFLSVKNVEDHPAPPVDNETWPLEDCVAHVT